LYPIDLKTYPWLNTLQTLNQYTSNVGYGTLDEYRLSGIPISYSDNQTIINLEKLGISLPVGISVIVRHQVYSFNVFTILSVNEFSVDDIVINFGGGMGIFTHFCRDVTISNVLVKSADQNYPMSLTADGLHLQNTYGTLIIRQCTFEGQGDDGINVVTSLLRITAISNSRTEIQVTGYSSSENPDLQIGDYVNILDGNLQFTTQQRIDNLVKNTVYFNNPLPTSVTIGDILYDVSSVPSSVVIEDCNLSYNRARGILAKGFNISIQNNVFMNPSGPAILIQTDACYFLEGPPSINVSIQQNTIYKANFGAAIDRAVITLQNLILANNVCADSLPNLVNSNVLIIKNLFLVDNTLPSIWIENTDSLFVVDNIFQDNPTGKQIQTNSCEHLHISGNVCNRSGHFKPCS